MDGEADGLVLVQSSRANTNAAKSTSCASSTRRSSGRPWIERWVRARRARCPRDRGQRLGSFSCCPETPGRCVACPLWASVSDVTRENRLPAAGRLRLPARRHGREAPSAAHSGAWAAEYEPRPARRGALANTQRAGGSRRSEHRPTTPPPATPKPRTRAPVGDTDRGPQRTRGLPHTIARHDASDARECTSACFARSLGHFLVMGALFGAYGLWPGAPPARGSAPS